MLRKLLPFCFLFTGAANASYVMQCTLDGVVVSEPKIKPSYLRNGQGHEIEREVMRFQFAVQAASAAARADSDCGRTLGGKTIAVLLNASYSRAKNIRKNDRLSINYLKKSDRGMPERISFSLPD